MPVEAQTRAAIALVFDMDGVIVNSNPLHTQAWREYTRGWNIDVGGDLAERMYGLRNDQIVRDFFGLHLSDAETAAHGAAKERLYRQMMEPKLPEALVPGVREFLDRHAGQPLGLATNAEPANVEFVLDRGNLRKYFQVVVDGHQVQHAKPDPEIYLRAAELLSVNPHSCIVFEDSYSGIAAARAAGMRVVGLRTTHRELPGADFEVDDFLDPRLESWLQAQAAELR